MCRAAGVVSQAMIIASPALGARHWPELVKSKLSQHEYPRHLAFVAELPKTPAGKVHRKVLREREAAASLATH